jgi:hypothetical protein
MGFGTTSSSRVGIGAGSTAPSCTAAHCPIPRGAAISRRCAPAAAIISASSLASIRCTDSRILRTAEGEGEASAAISCVAVECATVLSHSQNYNLVVIARSTRVIGVWLSTIKYEFIYEFPTVLHGEFICKLILYIIVDSHTAILQ